MSAAARPAAPASVHSIDAALPFADALAAGVLARYGEEPERLADIRILLPTRRAARSLREAFLRQSGGRALLLPRLAPLGDVDEDELLIADALDPELDTEIPPAVDGLERLALLSRLILKRSQLQGGEDWGVSTPAQAAALAGELARLLDSLQIEDVKIDRLQGLVPDRYAEHWKQTLRFLDILSLAWPDILRERGAIDPAERRNRLLRRQAALWRARPPSFPVIAAGSTGSIPATRELLAAIAGLPNGAVVLPGLDRRLSDAQWAALDQPHPQYGLRELLGALGLDRAQVADWPAQGVAGGSTARVAMWSLALQPPVEGIASDPVPGEALDGMRRIDCPTQQQEALTIALLMREALDTRGRSAALVTADRDLARRVAVELRRWNVEIDDSAGIGLLDTPPAVLLRLIGEATENGLAPVPLLSLLQHPLCALGLARIELLDRARLLDRTILRGPRPSPGIAGLRQALAAAGADHGGPDEAQRARLSDLIDRLERALQPLADAMARDRAEVPALARALAASGEAFATADEADGGQALWRGDAGEATAALIAALIERGADFGPVEGRLWPGLFAELAGAEAVRPRRGLHPRLFIWGPLEARLQRADLMILGGLNEGSWPPLVDTGPWLTRPMRQELGLPLPERRIGLAAHDFVQAACAPEIVLTRSERTEGAPTVKARWLARLDALLGHEPARPGAASPEIAAGRDWLRWADALDRPTEPYAPPRPPRPTPPLEARPRKLSVTAIETWRRDPYALYAGRILGLRPLDALDMDPTVRDRGTLIHEVLDAFLSDSRGIVTDDSESALLALGRERFAQLLDRPAERAFWWPRFERVARWFVNTQLERQREGIVLGLTEAGGEMTLNGSAGAFVVTAKADRIDRLPDGTLEIIDYKTGSGPSMKEVAAGYAPQLPLEALIARAGTGFARDGRTLAGRASRLSYWRLRGTDEGGAIEDVLAARPVVEAMKEHVRGKEDAAAALLRLTEATLRERIASYDRQATPYLSRPRPDFKGFGEYDHLARVQEWASIHGED